MRSDQPAPLDVETRTATKRWLDTWKRVRPIREAERWERLRAMIETDAQGTSQLILELWQPDWHGDDGEGLWVHQRVFSRARR